MGVLGMIEDFKSEPEENRKISKRDDPGPRIVALRHLKCWAGLD